MRRPSTEPRDMVPKHEPEVWRAKGRRYVAWCNTAVHDAPWIDGDRTTRGGIYIALELAEQAYLAHGLPYKQGLSNMPLYDPRGFTWIYDASGEARDCVKLRDNETGLLVIWPHWGEAGV